MSTTLEELIVALGLDKAAYSKGLADASSEGDSFVSKVVGGFGKLTFGAAAGGIAAVGGALYTAIGSASEAQDVFAQTEAVIKSTGGASGKTADQLAELAGNLSSASGASKFGDDAILQAENLLATFTEIKGPIFDQATQAMVDLGTAMHNGPEASAIQLGKALNDPVAGVSALSRVGVSFTDKQKGMIENFVKTNQMAKAQQVILDELGKEFGGSAAASAQTFSGKLATLKDKFGELLESAGTKFLPIVTQVVDVLNSTAVQSALAAAIDWLFNVISNVADFITNIAVPAFSGFISYLVDAWQQASDATSSFGETLGYFLDTVLGGLDENSDIGFFQSLALTLQTVIPQAISIAITAFNFLIDNIGMIASAVGGVVVFLATTSIINWFIGLATTISSIIPAITAAIAAISWPIVAIAAAVALLAVAWANNWGGIRDKTAAVIAFLKPYFDQVVAWLQVNIPIAIAATEQFITGTLVPAFNNIVAFINANVVPILKVIVAWLAENIPIAMAATSSFITGTLIPAFSAIWSFVSGTLLPILKVLVVDGFIIVTNVARLLAELFTNVLVPAATAVGSYISDTLSPVFAAIGNFITNTVAPAIQSLAEKLGIAKAAGDAANSIFESVSSAISAIGDAISGALSWIQRLIDKLNDIHVPKILEQHSPSPLEQSIIDVGQAAIDTATKIPLMQNALDGIRGLATGAGNNLLGDLGAVTNVGGVNVNATIDARGADRGTADRMRKAVDDLGKSLGNATDLRLRLGNV